ncbi:hypothetical protein Dda_8949 [Drechslerella dactyloides]|uniref:Beta-lactamase-related domain-containing protein n=1 Tax=Drechslerella dactyloides TaxID=74499 RepID=A0AAD6NH61_DREDA|nr:hypothetical protein Dda_8949 [Drechslerella dactyloides]
MEKTDGILRWPVQQQQQPRRRLRRRDLALTVCGSLIGSFVGIALAFICFDPASRHHYISPFNGRWRYPDPADTVILELTIAMQLRDVPHSEEAFPWKCTPPPPPFLLDDIRIASHPAVVAALADIKLALEANALVHKDAVSLSIVHASTGKLFEFHSGRVRLNESAADSPAPVDGDSIYRIASISKAFVVLEALILSRQAHLKGFTPELTLESRLKDVLPEFKLPAAFKEEEGEITLAHLGSHRAGLARDVGEFQMKSLNDIVYPPVGPGLLEDFPHNRSIPELQGLISKSDLIWQIGESPSYSNTGFSLLGMAVDKYHDKLWKQGKDFRAIMRDDIFTPLNMSHTFTGPIPPHLKKHVTVPAATHLVDKVFALSHDPAGGIFSTSNDLANLLHRVLLASKPELISSAQRRTWLKSVHQFTDGITSVGIPWETFRAIMPDFSQYNIYFKGGGLPAQFTEISVLPEFGYGVAALVSVGITDAQMHAGGNYSNPMGLSIQVHNTLAPAIWQAYNQILVEDYVGVYFSSDGFARIGFKEGMLALEQFSINGVDVLLKWDEVIWTEVGKRPRLFEIGAKLVGTAFEGQFRSTVLYQCSWTGFDAITTKSGWGMDMLKIKRELKNGPMVLTYAPMKAKLYKVA